MSSRHVLEGSPFAFLVRSMHIAPCRGREYDIKEVFDDCEVETCVVDPGGSSKFCAACFEESEHVVHGCALRDLGRMCMDVREAQTCDTTLEQVSKSRQTHEHCVAEDLVLKPGSEAVRDASRELERYVEGSCTAKLSFVPPGHRRAGCGLIDVLTSVMLLAKAQLCIAVSELFSAAVMILVSCSCAWTGEILSCRRMERALIGLRIPFWLKIAVVFATALCIRAEGVQPCCPAVGLKAEGIQPGCVAIGIRSEEAKPLSSDYVCSLSCRDGSFEDSGYGSAACSQPNYVQDDEQGRYKGVPAPIRRCHVRGCKAFIKSTKQCFSGGGSHVALVCRCSNGPARNDLWSTYPIPTMGWCDKSIFGCEHSIGAKPMDKPAASSLCTENVGVCLFGYEICRPCSGQLWPCGMLAVAESSLCVGVFGIHRPGFCGGRCTGQAEENIVRGCDHRRGPKEAAGTFIKGVFRCLFVGEWHQRPRCRELPKGRTTFGSGCLGYFCLAELYEGLRKSQDRRGAGHAPALSYESAWEADRAGLGIYSRGSVWASGFARNEPCLPGCVGGSELEDCGVQVAGYDACVLGYDPTYSTFGSSSCAFAGGSSIESCGLGERGFGIWFGIITPDAAGFQHPWGGRPAMPAPVTREGVFGPMPVGGAMIGGDAAPQTPLSFPILATPKAAMTPAPMTPDIPQATMTTAPMTPDIPQATMTPAPTTPDIHQATMTSAPTTPVSYPFQIDGRVKAAASMELSHLRGQRGRSASSDEQRSWQRQTSGGVCWSAPPPSPDAMSEASDSAVLERGF